MHYIVIGFRIELSFSEQKDGKVPEMLPRGWDTEQAVLTWKLEEARQRWIGGGRGDCGSENAVRGDLYVRAGVFGEFQAILPSWNLGVFGV